MSGNLTDAGINLRALTLGDYASLIEDINFNFAMLLSSPLFKGTAGDAGAPGLSGASGVRGSKWLVPNFQMFAAQWPGIAENAITIEYINAACATDPARIAAALGLQALLAGDMLLMPTGAVYTYSPYGIFADTGVYLKMSGSEVTQGWVQAQIAAIASPAVDNNIIPYATVAKYFRDGSAAGANDASPSLGKILDLAIAGAGSGAPIISHKFIGLAERTGISSPTLFKATDSCTYIAGAPSTYHELAQKSTGRFVINGDYATTDEYAPGVGDPAALAVLQKGYGNGIIFGNADSATGFREFGRLFLSKTLYENAWHNAALLTSSYAHRDADTAKDLSREFSELALANGFIKMRTPGAAVIDAQVLKCYGAIEAYGKDGWNKITGGDLEAKRYITSPKLSTTATGVQLCAAATDKCAIKGDAYLETVQGAYLLSTGADGKIADSGYEINDSTLDESILDSGTYMLPPTSINGKDTIVAGANLRNSLDTFVAAIQAMGVRMDGLEQTTESGLAAAVQALTASVAALTPRASQYGMISELYSRMDETNMLARYDAIFDGNGRGLPNARIYKATGDFETIDLSGYAICDGRNGTPDLTHSFVMGAVRGNTPYTGDYGFGGGTQSNNRYCGAYGGSAFLKQTESHLKGHTHSIAGDGSHTHPIASSGAHAHTVGAGGDAVIDSGAAGAHIHTASSADVPSHNHVFNGTPATNSVTGEILSSGSHNHEIQAFTKTLYATPNFVSGYYSFTPLYVATVGENTTVAGALANSSVSTHIHNFDLDVSSTPAGTVAGNGGHRHDVTINTAASHTHPIELPQHAHTLNGGGEHTHTASSVAHTHSIALTGNGEAMPITPKYTALFKIMWVGV